MSGESSARVLEKATDQEEDLLNRRIRKVKRKANTEEPSPLDDEREKRQSYRETLLSWQRRRKGGSRVLAK